MLIAVAGGTGYVGQAVRDALLAEGQRVRVIARHHRPLPPEVEFVPVNLRQGDLTAALAGVAAVINLVGIIQENPRAGSTFKAMHVEVPRRIMAAMAQAGIRRYLHMSALGTRAQARSRYHQTKWEAEQLVRHSGLDWTIVRPSLMFGGGADFFKTIAAQARWPATPVPGDGRTPLQPVFREDVARFFAAAVMDPATYGETFEIAGPDRMSLNALYSLVGRPAHPNLVHIPLAVLMTMARWGENLPGFPVTVDQLLMLGEANVSDDTRWTAIAGPATPLHPDRLP
ncbi:MAG: NAD(P)H-binding protein [Thermaerobacter sp.]|nr:NAD(P)H-binding protein [Thermaerobacter sp.]